MPIIPVTKIPTVVPQFAEYSIINNEFLPFTQSASLKTQPIPIHSFIDEEVVNEALELYRTEPNSVQFPAPTDGILKSFKFFQIESTTGFTYDYKIVNATKVTETVVFNNVPFSTAGENLFLTNNSLEISVDKGDLLNWLIDFDNNVPLSGTHIHQVYLSLNFKPTSSA